MENDWTPPSDAKQVSTSQSWQPPSDAVNVKKKRSTELPSPPQRKGTTSATVKTTTQKPSESSGGKPEGLYTAPGNQLAVFKKTADGWYVDNNRSGNFIKLQKGDVEKRVQALEKDAKKLYDADYENNITWQKAEPQKVKKEEPSLEKKMAQEVFKEEFFVTPKENMRSLDQVDFVAKEKTKRDLGENASEKDRLATEEKYKKEGTLKLLKREGYDVDVNSDFNDPKVRKALAEYNANEDLKNKSQIKQNKLFDLTDKIITSQKMGYTEEALVPLLRKNFSNYGFEFEESGLGDAISVRYSADGITYTDNLEIDLQSSNPDAEMNKLKTFINNRYLKDSEKAALNNEKLKTKDLIDITSKNPYKYGEYMLSEGEFDNYITSEYRSANSLKVQIDDKINKFQKLSEEYSRTNDENTFNELKTIESDISKDQKNLTYKLAEIEQTENKYKESVGSYILQREKQGNFVGGIFASASKGLTAIPRLMFNVGADILPELLPNKGLNPLEYQQMKNEGMSDSEIGSVVSSKIKREIGKDLKQGIDNIGSLGTVNEEYFSSVDRNILEQAVFGLSESVGASFSGGGNAVSQGLAFFGMSYNTMADELSSKEFDELNKWEKSAISGVYGLMIGQLEKIGFNMSSGQMKSPLMKKFSSTVIKNALKDMPENATVETIDQLVGTSLRNTMKATGIKVVNGSISEGVTEGVQSLSEVSLKNLVNEIHDKKVFEYVPDLTTKKGVVDALESSLYEASAGAIGGAIMGSFDTYRQSKVNENSDEKFQDMYASLMDDNTLRAVKLNEVIRYKNGEISKDQARSNINEINKTVGTLNKIPSELGVRGKKIAFELLTEKEGLQNKIEGKDKNLVSQEINRITEIDNQLKTISENATKKSTEQQQEVTAEGGVVQRQGVDEGQPEVGQGEGPVGQATQQGTDLGNRPVESRSEEEVVTPILSSTINVSDDRGRKGLVPISELDDFIGEDRTGEAEMPKSRANIDKLKEDILKNGFKEPIVLIYDKFSNGGEASIIEGNHRIIAAKELGFKEIPVTFEKGTIRSNESRVSEGMFPLNRKFIGNINDTYGVKGLDLGLNVRQPNDMDYVSNIEKPTEAKAVATEETTAQVEPTEEEGKKITKEEDVLKLDTKEENNLQKVLNALDKIEKDLDQFGKETLGVNIPVALAKTIVKAVKTLVKTGITLEQAIKQIASEYNLSDIDIKSLITPKKVSDIDVNEVRSKDRPGKRISKGISVKTVGGNKVIEETEGLSLEYVKENAPKVFISNANIISKYPLIAGKKKFETATTIEEAQEIYDVFVREVANNLNYLMDEFKPEFREISTLWYDGANAIANDFADQFGVSAEQASGIIAAMSPQKDWYQNVRLAEMVLMAYKDNPVMTKEMIDYQKGVNEKGLYEGAVSPGKKLNNAEKEYKRSKTKANKEALDEAKDKLNKAIEKANSVISMLEQYIGKKLNDVPAFVQPYMVRTYHEVNTTKDYNIVAPDGSVQGVARKNDGTKAKVAWGSYSEIGKAVAIYNDGSQENITKSLGEMHKIRNFYNNIIDPMSKDGDVTMDTHAIAAALLLPLSGNSVQVGQNFGTGTSNSAPFGIKGLYYAYADAYALSAKENNLLPRQVQSITWEAIRGLYTDTFKSNKTQVANINNIWKEYQDGKITIDEARKQAKDAAGGIKDPTWARPIQDELGEISKEESISGRGKGDGRNIVGGTEGGDVLTADTKDKKILKKALDFLDKADNDLNKFGKETLGINIPVATMRAIIKLAKTLVKTGITLQDAIIQAAEQKNVSKKDALNAIKFMSETINRPVKKVIVNEMTALRDQLKFESRAARESQQDLKRKQRELIVTVNKMKRSGTVTANQAAVLAKKITYLNVYNPVMVDRFLQYAERLFKNAEYQNILSNAQKVRKSIKNFMKNNQANVVAMAKDFTRVNPAMVEDIDVYIENANAVLNAVKRSKDDTNFAIKNAADINAINTYTEDMLQKQEEQLKNEKLKEYQDLVDLGVIDGSMTLKEINDIIKSIEEEGVTDREKKETELRRFLNTRFDRYSTIIKDMLKNKVDPFTGDEVEISEKDREVLKRLMNVNLDLMSVKNAYTIVESMDNFIVNGITDGLDGAISTYEGDVAAKEARAEGIKAKKIKLYFSPVVGRALYENFATLPVLFDSMFRGVKSGMSIMKKMGFDLLSNGTAKAMNIYNKAINEYGETFAKKRPNDQAFNTSYNAYERGMLAYLKRTVPGSEKAQKEELNRRIGVIEKSIDILNEYGNDDQIKISELYREIFDKLDLSKADITIEQIEDNVDSINADAVNWWINQWSKHYSDLYDVSLSVYNTKLGKDINYTTDRYSRVDGERELVEEATGKIGAFALDLGLVSYKDKAGVLMESNKNLTKSNMDTGNKSTTRFVNLDFDMSNAGSLKSALIDVNTASAIRRVDAFLNSRSYDKLFQEEKDAKLLKRRVENYILRYKNKMAFSDATLGDLDRYLDVIAAVGATRALGGPSQAVLQTVPVFLSTMINAGARNVDFAGMVSDTNFHSWLNNSGYAIANRGMETSTAIESANKYLDKAPDTKGKAALEYVKKLNEFWLKKFLSQPDVWIARNSWKSYYTQSLKEQGLYNGNIDWTTHKLNKEAADYAQHMVDRQQNVSDAAMMGDFMNSPQPIKKIVRKVVLPFANFIMNQKTRLYSDIRTLSTLSQSTSEDKWKAIRSLGGLATEMAAYNAIAYALKLYLYDGLAALITGYEDDEEEKEKNKRNRKKFVLQNLVKDVFSPLPVTDGLTIQGFNAIADFVQERTVSQEDINQAVEERNLYLENRGKDLMTDKEKEKFIKDFVDSKKMVFEEYGTKQWIDLGTATIAIDKAVELYDMIAMTTTGKFKKEFNGKEVEKSILPEDKTAMGLATTFSALYNLGLLPREFNSEAMSIKKYVEKKAISENQLEDYNTIKKETGDVDGYKMDLLKSKMKIDNVLEEIDWVESKGGLTKEQSIEYSKLRKIQGEVYADDLAKIKKGIKAEKIYK